LSNTCWTRLVTNCAASIERLNTACRGTPRQRVEGASRLCERIMLWRFSVALPLSPSSKHCRLSRRRNPYRVFAVMILIAYVAVAATYVVVAAWAVSTGLLPSTGYWQGRFYDALLPRINEVV